MSEQSSSRPPDATMAQTMWEFENKVQTLDPRDEIFKFDAAEQKAIAALRPWAKDPHYFKKVRISAVALVKMVIHARSGGNLEVMGMMLGKVQGDTMIVMDSFELPVEGTETRVNATDAATEYMVKYMEDIRKVGRMENILGWYHSHPGYGCWLSGIDVGTQRLNQSFQEPFLAIVIDPNRTISAGKVEIGAFRTYPEGYKPPADIESEYQSIPMNKIEDFGVHAKEYYNLEISTFKSSLDTTLLEQLWNKYWMSTLRQNVLLTNRDYMTSQMLDLSEKIDLQTTKLGSGTSGSKKSDAIIPEGPLTKLVRDSNRITGEQVHGLVSQVIKNVVFSMK